MSLSLCVRKSIATSGDRALGYRDPAVDQGVMDFGDTAVLRIATVAHKGDDIEAKFVLGEGQAAFGFWAVRFARLWAMGLETASNLQGQSEDGVQGRDCTVIVIGGPHGVAAAWAVTDNRHQRLVGRWGWPGCGTSHRDHLQVCVIPMVSVSLASSFSAVCYPRKKHGKLLPSYRAARSHPGRPRVWLYRPRCPGVPNTPGRDHCALRR